MRARARVAWALLVLAGTLGLAGSALAEARARVLAAWRADVTLSLRTIAQLAPPPAPPRTSVSSSVSAAPAPPAPRARRAHASGAPVELAPDERLDEVRARFCPEAARRLCHARQRCGCVYAEPDCEERLERVCTEELFDGFEDEAEDYELDPAILARCLDGFADLPTHCQTPAAVAHGCTWPVREVIDRDETCVSSGGPCRGGLCDGERVCSVPPESGEMAYSGIGCSLDDVEVDGRCLPSGGLGAACTDFHQCHDGVLDCTDGRCVARPSVGAECAGSDSCDAGLACVDGSCRTAPIWCDGDTDCGSEQACILPPMTCSPCSAGVECEGEVRCADGARCGPGMECVDPSENGRCGPTLCRMPVLEDLFEDLT